ncbi:hypothetical protein [Microbulbifer sp. ANSA005]|uniref:hypothetical protein n=1 Tax=Microbulbifer sp. ANSA005 TaxID=3243362 RepID=UPI00404169BB
MDFSDGDTTIAIRGGTYYAESVKWTETDKVYRLIIKPYADEEPVFEGQGSQSFFNLSAQDGQCTNVEISGLTLRNYATYGIIFNGGRQNRASSWNGCNKIHDNKFVEMGTLFDVSNCPEGCAGYGVVDVVNSKYNVIYNNVFHKAENIPEQSSLMHAVYLAHNSSENEVYGNYFYTISGDPVRVRDASNFNNIHSNYSDRSGKIAFLSSWRNVAGGEQPSFGNLVKNNIITFPYRDRSKIEVTATLASDDVGTFIEREQKFYHGDQIVKESIGGTIAGDFNGDGLDEILVALNYNDFTKVVLATGGEGKYLKDVVYIGSDYKVSNLESGNYGGGESDQAITVLSNRESDETIVYRGNGTRSLFDQGQLFNSVDMSIDAIVSGDFDGDGASEIVTAMTAPSGETIIYRGDGIEGLTNMGVLHRSDYWEVPALASGDFLGAGHDQLTVAFQSDDETRIYRGDGITSATGYGYFYSSPDFTITAMEANDFSGSSLPSLVTAFKRKTAGDVSLYSGDGMNTAMDRQFYSSIYWDITALTSGSFSRDGSVNLVESFTNLSQSQIWAGNGVSSISSGGLIHKLEKL